MVQHFSRERENLRQIQKSFEGKTPSSGGKIGSGSSFSASPKYGCGSNPGTPAVQIPQMTTLGTFVGMFID